MGSAAAQALCAESLTQDTGKTLLALGTLVLDRGCRATVAFSHTSPTWPWVGAARASLSSHRARLSAERVGDRPRAKCHWAQGRGHSCLVRPMTVPRDIPGNSPQTEMG